MKDIINKNDKGLFLSRKPIIFLKKKTLKIEFKPDDIKRFLKYHKRFFVFSLTMAVSVFGAVIYLAVTKAEIIDFYPVACLGGWENSQNVQGRPELGKDALPEEFNEANSAVLKNVISQIFCGNFQGEMPENSQPKKVSLKFSWAVKTESEPLTDNNFSESTSTLIEIISPEATSTETDTPPEEAAPSPPASFLNKIINLVFAEEIAVPQIPIEKNPTPSFMAEISATSSLLESLPELLPEPEVSTSVPEENIFTEASLIETITETAATEATVITEIPVPPEPFLEILYTIDGADWQSLGKVNLDSWQNLALEIPNFNWEDVSRVQIAIQSLSPVDFAPIVYLDGLWLEVEYEIKKSMTVLTESILPSDAEMVLQDEKGMEVNDLSPLDKKLFSVPANSKIFPGQCSETSYVLNDTNKNIYVYKESDTTSAYRDFGVVESGAVISIGFGKNGENICPLSLYEEGIFHFLEVDDPERIICADNIGYEECKSKSTGKETILEMK